MAGTKTPHRFLTSFPAADTAADDDFDESDVWGFGPETRPEDRRKPIPARRSARKKAEKRDRPIGSPAAAAAAASLPVNIPDWSKILKKETRGSAIAVEFEGGDEDVMGSGSVIPPHELLCRRREASFSVQEGVGRTLKGRDLSRVRDAIWERTGFED